MYTGSVFGCEPILNVNYKIYKFQRTKSRNTIFFKIICLKNYIFTYRYSLGAIFTLFFVLYIQIHRLHMPHVFHKYFSIFVHFHTLRNICFKCNHLEIFCINRIYVKFSAPIYENFHMFVKQINILQIILNKFLVYAV